MEKHIDEVEVVENIQKPDYISSYLNKLDPSTRMVVESVVSNTILCSGSASIIFTLSGARLASLRYTAENAHHRPKTNKGWYQYHRQKNYSIAYEGIKYGVKHGLRLGSVAFMVLSCDAALDLYRGRVEWWHSGAAGLCVSSLFSAIYRLPFSMFRKAAVFGGGMGLLLSGANYASAYYEGRDFGSLEGKYQQVKS